MKLDPFFDGFLKTDDMAALDALSNASKLPFHEQVRAAGLNPAMDLQHADLSDIDLSNANLAGFNFTGANLRGAYGSNVAWSDNTVFEGAELEGSVLAAPLRISAAMESHGQAQDLLTRVSRMGTTQAILWMADQLKPRAQYNSVATIIAEALFIKSDDVFLRSQLLFFLTPYMPDITMRELVLASLEQGTNGPVVRAALATIRKRGLASEPAIRRTILGLLGSENFAVREASLSLLVRTGLRRYELEDLLDAVSRDTRLKVLYAAELARSLGGEFEIAVRHPVTRDVQRPSSYIPTLSLYLIARRWLRLEANTREAKDGIPLAQRTPSAQSFEPHVIKQRMQQLYPLYDQLKRYGIEYLFDRNAHLIPNSQLPREWDGEEERARRRSRPKPIVGMRRNLV